MGNCSPVSRAFSRQVRQDKLKEAGVCIKCYKRKEKTRMRFLICRSCALKEYNKQRARKGLSAVVPKFPRVDNSSQCSKCGERAGKICSVYGYEIKNVRFVCARSPALPVILVHAKR
jgi:hypothetical protein